MEGSSKPVQEITEGQAKVQTSGSVFYNPVQEFNRDLSLSVISTYAKNLLKNNEDFESAGTPYANGITILEALSATGLRSIRYAKEIPGVKHIVANDISAKAVEDIRNNIALNNVQNVVRANLGDANMLMYQHKKDHQFDVVDLDPYGCPSIFLDSAVQSVKNGGLLLVTATDMAVLAGNCPETCYSKYGAISLRMKCCHEMALRILLQCIEAHANRYGRYIEPVLSLSADFYIRVFVRVYSGAQKCKFTISKLSHVYHCTGCDSFVLQPLGITKQNEKNNQLVKFCLPAGPPVGSKCEHCGGSYHIGGPIWSAPLHQPEFVKEVLNSVSPALNTFKRIQGVLSMILEELSDVPLYYTLERLAGTIRVETPSMMAVRSALVNAGYRVSQTHTHKTSIKTDAPPKVVWDIMRCWEKLHPASKKRLQDNKVAATILDQSPDRQHTFDINPNAYSAAKEMGLLRFQANPLPFWGPGSRAQAMLGQNTMLKSHKNQGKRKRPDEEPQEETKHD
ncbi:probable tRNA (guanine(26)-N(2))-dimethyltransferase isoform X2 [Anthonomus grandis grandis]|nr:probable tRNA (guanine(26)-N(2))-dimethyltransferase isoform X2 [Anthonomus grandis grandis]